MSNSANDARKKIEPLHFQIAAPISFQLAMLQTASILLVSG
jgi:hypothetical protein